MGPARRGQVWLSRVTCVTCDLSDALLKERRKSPKPPNPRPKTSDLSVLELMGEFPSAVPAGNSSDFFGQLSMPCASFGNFSAAPRQPGWRNAEGLQSPASPIPVPSPAAGLTPGVGTGLGAGRPRLGALPCPLGDGHGYSLCHQRPFADACGRWTWWWFILEEEVWMGTASPGVAGLGCRWWVMVWGRG